MKQNNHLFDDFLKGQVEEAEVTFKEEYWQKMESLLDQEEGKKSAPWWRKGLGIVLALLAIGTSALVYKKATHQSPQERAIAMAQGQTLDSGLDTLQNSGAEVTTEQNKSLEGSENATETPQEETALSSQASQVPDAGNTNGNSSKATPSTSGTLPKAEKSGTQPQIDEVAKVAAVDQSKPASSKSGIQSDVKISQTAKKAPLDRKEKSTKTSQTLATTSGKNSTKNSDRANASSQQGQQLKQPKLGNPEKASVNQSVENKNEVLANKEPEITDSEKPTPNTRVINGKTVQAKDSFTYSRRQAVDPSQSNPRYIAALENYLPEYAESVKVVKYEPVKEVPVVNTSASEEIKPLRPAFESQPMKFFITAGCHANLGMQGTLNRRTALGFAPLVGAGLEKQIAEKLTMSAHVGFTYFNGLNTQKQVSSQVYSFGLDSSVFSVEHKKMMQMYLPVSVLYEWVKNHYVLAGFGASYSLDVSGTVQDNQVNSKSAYGYRSGFNPLDLFLQAGYQFKLNDQISFALWYQQGLLDATRNAYFENNATDRQTRFGVGIKYSFSRNGQK